MFAPQEKRCGMETHMYAIKDLFTTSYAEGERNKYKKAVKKLDQEIPLITEYIGYVREYTDDIHNAYTENGGSNEGQYVTRFDEKENDNHLKVTTIIQNMEWALTDPQDKRTYASTQYSYWQEVCEQEDAMAYEYKPS